MVTINILELPSSSFYSVGANLRRLVHSEQKVPEVCPDCTSTKLELLQIAVLVMFVNN